MADLLREIGESHTCTSHPGWGLLYVWLTSTFFCEERSPGFHPHARYPKIGLDCEDGRCGELVVETKTGFLSLYMFFEWLERGDDLRRTYRRYGISLDAARQALWYVGDRISYLPQAVPGGLA
jgi:hypothetical protein